MKTTVTAPSNIAFIKYWGATDLDRVLPTNPSLSMTLDHCLSRTTVELLAEDAGDEILLAREDGSLAPPPPGFARGIAAHLERLRRWAGRREGVRLATVNTFPTAAGIASSASGFAAMTCAVTRAFAATGSETPDAATLSNLARSSGSGSAARSVLGGYVQWPDPGGVDDDAPHAAQVAPAAHWDLRDVIALIETGPKDVSSRDGHRRAPTSPYFERRLETLPGRLEATRRALADRDFGALAPVLEEEAVDLHLIAMSSKPPVFYWAPGTLSVLEAVRDLRAGGVACGSTMDAGANVHVICPPESEEAVVDALGKIPAVRGVIRDRVGNGPVVSDEHLL
jgi:diphosphomevalonate decarboxylase